MNAFQEHKFTEGFLLDESRINKLREIIIESFANINPPISPKYTVWRADSSSYTTENIKEIFNEENSKWNRIKRFQITGGSKYTSTSLRLYCDIDFRDEWLYTTYLKVEGEDKHAVDELFAKLKHYLSKKVNTFRGVSRWIEPREVVVPVTTIVLYLLLLFGFVIVKTSQPTYNISNKQIDSLLKSENLNEKLNFLIKSLVLNQNNSNNNTSFLTNYVVIFSVSLILFWLLSFLVKNSLNLITYLFPRCVFMIGEGKGDYEGITKMREKIIWGVIIAFLVSLVAGLPYFILTK